MKSVEAIIKSRRKLIQGLELSTRKTCEGGCGVIGIIGTERMPGKRIIRPCEQMRNRGNGKGGGVAAAGLFDGELADCVALHVAYLEQSVQSELEKKYIEPVYEIIQNERLPHLEDHREADLEVRPPEVQRYFVKVKDDAVEKFAAQINLKPGDELKDELIFQNSFRLNRNFYLKNNAPRAFVLSHGRDLMILKAVGYAEQVARYYLLEETGANVWIGHQRYPTRGRVWHPGGAHPFAGLHEALVHNGDFANYYAVTEYLRQRGVAPLFVTDTEVSVLLFDLYSRVLNYPLEYVIEALAPTPEGDFERLSKSRQRIYRAIQRAHLQGSPDGPWFFIIARNDPQSTEPQLIGITDVSMLRPQVFAVQMGKDKSFGAIGSEKQAIDAFFEEIAADDPEVLPVADKYWNARGGSCTDGGAFVFSLKTEGERRRLEVHDKFGNDVAQNLRENAFGQDDPKLYRLNKALEVGPDRLLTSQDTHAGVAIGKTNQEKEIAKEAVKEEASGQREMERIWGELFAEESLRRWAHDLRKEIQAGQIEQFDNGAKKAVEDIGAVGLVKVLTFLHDRPWNPLNVKRALALTLLERQINRTLDSIFGPEKPNGDMMCRLTVENAQTSILDAPENRPTLIVDARGFTPEGENAVNRMLVKAHKRGWRNFIVYRCRGDRFLGCGLGKGTEDVRIDVYGSSGDYLGSGVDGAQIYVHGDAQDQVGQIFQSGRIVIFGNTGQTFLYGAKGGEAYVMGNAAGRPLINAVGKIRAIINGTSLDYCAESFMAGRDVGDGFVILNGITFDSSGGTIGLETKYPGNNLFSLASGGACYLNDPYRTVKTTQLNGAEFIPFRQNDWNAIVQYLRQNETFFGLSIRHDLLLVDGVLKWPKEVFRKVVASSATSKLDWSSLPE